MNRFESLDWLRGLLALSIMLYHLTGWTLYAPGADELLGRLGIYGVSMFFVLSGLSMAIGYHAFIVDRHTAARFFVRRIFRIWPLLWLAVAVVTLAAAAQGRPVDWVNVAVNVTTLFGFIDPGAYINTGAWSIGNEMVYYALTPLFILAYQRGRWLGNSVVGATWLCGLWFSLVLLKPQDALANQWLTYIHPANNLCLYAAGVAMYFNLDRVAFKPTAALALLAGAVLVFAAYPLEGDLIRTVTGAERIVFFAASCALVLAFYKNGIHPPAWITRPFAALGVATYGVYLLHPLVYGFVKICARFWPALGGPAAAMTATVALTVVVALALYRWFEEPFIRLGKRLTRGGGREPAVTAAATARVMPR